MAGFTDILYALTAMLLFAQEKTNDLLAAFNFITFRNILTISPAPEVEFVTQTIRYTQTTTLSASTSTVLGPVTTLFVTTYRASATGAPTLHHDPTYMAFVDRNPWDGLLIFALLTTVMTIIAVFALASRLRKGRSSVTEQHSHQKLGLNENISAFWSRMMSTCTANFNTLGPMWQASWSKGLSILSAGLFYLLVALRALFLFLCWTITWTFTHVMTPVYSTVGPYVRVVVCWILWDFIGTILATAIHPFQNAYQSWTTPTQGTPALSINTAPSRHNLTGTPRQPNHFSTPYSPADAQGRQSDSSSQHEVQALKNEVADLKQRLQAEKDSHNTTTRSQTQLQGDLAAMRCQLDALQATVSSHDAADRLRNATDATVPAESSTTTEDRGVQTDPEDHVESVAPAEAEAAQQPLFLSTYPPVPQDMSRPIKPRFNPKSRSSIIDKRRLKSPSTASTEYVSDLKSVVRHLRTEVDVNQAQVGVVMHSLEEKDTEIKDLHEQIEGQDIGSTLQELAEKDMLIDLLRSEVTTKARELEDAVAQKDALEKNKKAQDNEYTEGLFEREKTIGQLEEDLEGKVQELQDKDEKIRQLVNALEVKGKEVQSKDKSLFEVQMDLLAKQFGGLELEQLQKFDTWKQFALEGEKALDLAKEELGAMGTEFLELQSEVTEMGARASDRWSQYQFSPVDNEVDMGAYCPEQPLATNDVDMEMLAEAPLEGAQQEDSVQDNQIPGLGLLREDPLAAPEACDAVPMHHAPAVFSFDGNMQTGPAFAFGQPTLTPPGMFSFASSVPAPAPADHAMDMADDVNWASWLVDDGGRNTEPSAAVEHSDPLPVQNALGSLSAGVANPASADQTMEMDDATPCGYTEASAVGGDLETAATEQPSEVADDVDSRVLLLQDLQSDQSCEAPTEAPAETTNMEEGASSSDPSTGAQQEETSAPTSYVPTDEDYEELEEEFGDLYAEPSSSSSAPAVPGRAILKPKSQSQRKARAARPTRAESPPRNLFATLANPSPAFVYNPATPQTVAVPVAPSPQFVPGPMSFEANLPPIPMGGKGKARAQEPAPAPVATSAEPVSRAPQTPTTPAYHETAQGVPRLEPSGYLAQMIADARKRADEEESEESEEE
ncbi:hypothetical protein H2202_005999 [Exophiala xenobiotica]|nr:hypothetical protein H2202_005999 [Exophiala xenobiotica]